MISSCVVVAKDNFLEQLDGVLNANCERIIDGKYIILIETNNFDENIAVFNKIKALSSVIDINMCFCESEEFNLEQNAQKIADKVNSLASSQKIEYYGDIYKRF